MRQLALSECGAACLAMVLRYHGRQVRLDEVRDVRPPGRDGLTARDIVHAARAFGLRGRGVRVEIEDVPLLPRATILHWELRHFVVLDRVRRGGVDIVDPAVGPRRVSDTELRRALSGVALMFDPPESPGPARARRGVVVRTLLRALATSGAWWRIVVASLVLQVFGLVVPLVTGALVDRVILRRDLALFQILAVGVVGLLACHVLTLLVRGWFALDVRTEIDRRLSTGFLAHLLALPYAFFERRHVGDLLLRINSIANVREMLSSGVLSALLDGTLVVTYGVLLALSEPGMTALALGLGAAQLAVVLATRHRQRALLARYLDARSASESHLVEAISGIETLKAMGAEQRTTEHWTGLLVNELNAAVDRGRVAVIVEAVTSTLMLAAPLVLVGYGALRVVAGELSLGAMLALASVAQQLLHPLHDLVSSASLMQLMASHLERIEDIHAAPPEQRGDRQMQVTGQLALERVSFAYAPTAPPVVEDISLEIAAGSFVAIVGPSGSGKSTLASLLAGLHMPTQGRVVFDGTPTSELDLPALRRQLGVVTQRARLFGGSIRANLALSDPTATLDRIEHAARLACIHDEIAAMPLAYDTVLADGGASLAGGQRQRLALARALLHDPALLILDEATSALDAVTERRVVDQLDRLPCTRIVIAHRLSTIRDADLIVVVDGGRIVERGRHAELVAARGRYAELVAAQLAR